MRKKVISMILVLANVFTLASCSIFGEPDATLPSKDGRNSEVKEQVFGTIEKIGNSLADCDLEKFTENSVASSREMEKKMPVVNEDDDTDIKKPKITNNSSAIRQCGFDPGLHLVLVLLAS